MKTIYNLDRSVKQLLERINKEKDNKDVVIAKNSFILACNTAEYLLSVLNNRDWKDCKIIQFTNREQDYLICLE